ncbi:hypothetical protein [Baekduia sp. Peel2402]|uniref:hypothetical protein n=1 Tax=Baekduia sp. Peel2402 TaxID=3458296 RepID=UPI00403EC430
MEHDVTNDLDRRLRAARPAVGDAPVDEALLARLRSQPIARRRTVPRRAAVPVAAAGATVLVTATVMLAGAPGGGGGPETASAITQALRWFDPPKGSTLHVRSVATSGSTTTVRELWQSADNPRDERFAYRDDRTAYEVEHGAFYDPATNTIYKGDYAPEPMQRKTARDGKSPQGKLPADENIDKTPDKRKLKALGGTVPRSAPAPANPAGDAKAKATTGDKLPAGDPMVIKIRMLLQQGRATVGARETHDGVDAFPITLEQGLGRPQWTLWIAAADGHPLELLDPGRGGDDDRPERVRWTNYDLGGSVTTLAQAHPDARVVDDAPAAAAAAQRLEPTLR